MAFRGGGKEMPSTLEILVTQQPKIRLVDEGGRIEGMAGGLGGHLGGSEPAQFVIDERQQVIGGLAVARLGSLDETGHVGHAAVLPVGATACQQK
jgi:hypothetical protein